MPSQTVWLSQSAFELQQLGIEGFTHASRSGSQTFDVQTMPSSQVGGVPFTQSPVEPSQDRKSTRLNSSHLGISYAVFCLKKKKKTNKYNTKINNKLEQIKIVYNCLA